MLIAACIQPRLTAEEHPPQVAGPGPLAETGAGSQPGALQVSLPGAAHEPTSLREPRSGVTARFRLEGARPAPASLSGSEASYEGALGAGTTLLLRRIARGVEDLVQFETRPAREEVSYLLSTRGFAGLRAVSGVVELLDADGAPRLRVEPPVITGADGRVARASLEVGCAHDRSPVGPWGRPVTPPGADECRLTVRWEGQDVAYPAVLDPAWSSTQDATEARGYASGAVLSDGRVLLAGGLPCTVSCPPSSATELFDPATETWAVTGPLVQARSNAPAVNIPGKGVLVAGGDTGNAKIDETELYDPVAGTWAVLPPLGAARADGTLTLTKDGKTAVMVGGGLDSTTALNKIDLLDVTTLTWSDGGPLQQPRFLHAAQNLEDGRLLIMGGATCTSFKCAMVVAAAEIYDPGTKLSVKTGSMGSTRGAPVSGVLTIDGAPRVVVAGGGNKTAEYYDQGKGSWVSLPPMASDRIFSQGVVLPDNTWLMAAGAAGQLFVSVASTERFDPVSKTWSSAGSLATTRAGHLMVLLTNGKALTTGGFPGTVVQGGTKATAKTELFKPQPDGSACVGGGECASLHCVDGFCCDTACNGECVSCAASQKGSGQDGTCGPVASDTDPSDECPDAPASKCSTTGMCDGKGACARYPIGTLCGPGSCDSGVAITQSCAGEGNCESKTEPCSPYFCQDPTVCASSCDTDAQCVSGSHCLLDSKTCEGNRPPGATCKKSSECASSFCVDSVCCATPCDGTCLACAAATKQSGDKSGACGPAKSGTDPRDSCATEPARSCGQSGSCDGTGKCSLYDKGTKCLDNDCSGSKQTELKGNEYACDGMGTCAASKSTSCGEFVCDMGACKSTCTDDKGCVEHAYCAGGSCVEKKPLGTTCKESRECGDGFCADGVCCNSPCDGTCEACNLPKALGYCIPVTGSPAHNHPACPAAPAATPCKQLTCDGITRDQCVGFVGPTVTCRQPSCAMGLATSAAVCDGKGNCAEQVSQKCEPFVCQGASCGAKCKADTDCSAKFQCDLAAGDCVPRSGASCDGDHTLTTPDGKTSDCAPYKCEGASCRRSCSSVLDCVLPSICDEATRTCLPAPSNPTADAGCAALDGGSRSPASPLALLAALALAARVARRPRKRSA